EPGSNSPKIAQLALRLHPRVRPLAHPSRISCHSSLVKVQRPGQDEPRRRPTMMGRRRRPVKPGDRPVRLTGPTWTGSRTGAARGRMVGAGPNGCQTAEPADTDPDERQSGLFSTSRMKAAALSHESSPSSADGVAPAINRIPY